MIKWLTWLKESAPTHCVTTCIAHLRTWLDTVPSQCVVCELPVRRDNLCTLCIAELPRLSSVCHRCALPVTLGTLCGPCLLKPPPWRSIICAVPYTAPFDKLMAGFKFQGRTQIATALSALLIDAIKKHPPTSIFELVHDQDAPDLPDILVPVPLHWTRLWKRGFNQAVLLAEPVGKQLDVPIVHALVRSRRTRAQTLVESDKRNANLRKAFYVQSPVKGLHIAILDDVVTTGATATSATKTLLLAGAKSVRVWACVRAKSHHPTKPSQRRSRAATRKAKNQTVIKNLRQSPAEGVVF